MGMTQHTIKRIIRRKLKDWTDTLPDDVKKAVEGHLIVTGGCIASMLLGETVNDFDIYCDSKSVAYTLAKYYVDVFNASRKRVNSRTKIPYVTTGDERVCIYTKSSGVAGENEGENDYQYFEQDPDPDSSAAKEFLVKVTSENNKKKTSYRPVFLSENAITLSDQIQIIIRFIGMPDEIHRNYDYVHATNYYYSGTNELTLRNKALASLLSKTLIYQGSLYPVCSLFRMRKFIERGWTISAGEITKMALQVSSLDLTNMSVLRQQLIGVDFAFFVQLIRLLEDLKEKSPGVSLDASYVIQLIDELVEKDLGF